MMEQNYICIADHLLQNTSVPGDLVLGESTFREKMGGTTYEVATHFDSEGRQSVLEQFRDLVLAEHLT